MSLNAPSTSYQNIKIDTTLAAKKIRLHLFGFGRYTHLAISYDAVTLTRLSQLGLPSFLLQVEDIEWQFKANASGFQLYHN